MDAILEQVLQAYKLAFLQYMNDDATTVMPEYLSSLNRALVDMGVDVDKFQVEILEERDALRREAEEQARQLAGLWVDISNLQATVQDRIWGYGQKYPELEYAGEELYNEFNAYLQAIEAEQCELSDKYGV